LGATAELYNQNRPTPSSHIHYVAVTRHIGAVVEDVSLGTMPWGISHTDKINKNTPDTFNIVDDSQNSAKVDAFICPETELIVR